MFCVGGQRRGTISVCRWGDWARWDITVRLSHQKWGCDQDRAGSSIIRLWVNVLCNVSAFQHTVCSAMWIKISCCYLQWLQQISCHFPWSVQTHRRQWGSAWQFGRWQGCWRYMCTPRHRPVWLGWWPESRLRWWSWSRRWRLHLLCPTGP